MRLIDADKLIERLEPFKEKYGTKKFSYELMHEAFIYEVEQEPTVDAVPVVRCKDCVDWNCADPEGLAGVCTYDDHERIRFKWEYCSDGDRGEE